MWADSLALPRVPWHKPRSRCRGRRRSGGAFTGIACSQPGISSADTGRARGGRPCTGGIEDHSHWQAASAGGGPPPCRAALVPGTAPRGALGCDLP